MSPPSRPGLRLAANLAFLFTELPWPQRPAAARKAGFAEVEFPWPAEPDVLADAVRRSGVDVALLNMPAGDLAAGERGFSNDPRRCAEWRDALDRALRLASRLSCPTVNVLAGTAGAGVSRQAQLRCLVDNLRWGARHAAEAGVRLVVESINSHDIPGYLLPRVADVVSLLDRLDADGLGLDPATAPGVQLDSYHLAREGEDPIRWIHALGPRLGHVQLADYPGRHEPGSGFLPISGILRALVNTGYPGAIGLEYLPTPGSDPTAVATAVRHAAVAAAGPDGGNL